MGSHREREPLLQVAPGGPIRAGCDCQCEALPDRRSQPENKFRIGRIAVGIVAVSLLVLATRNSSSAERSETISSSGLRGPQSDPHGVSELAKSTLENDPSQHLETESHHYLSRDPIRHGLDEGNLDKEVSTGGYHGKDSTSAGSVDVNEQRNGGKSQGQPEPKASANSGTARASNLDVAANSREPRGVSHGTPNVFFFLIDDMGWDDIGYQSTDLSEITPNLNNMAKNGVKLGNYYSMSICTPARASLMTGRYPVRYGMQYYVIVPGAPWGLPLDEKLMPEYMNDAGYESHMVGKWHIGSFNEPSMPQARGFDSYLGYLHGEENYWTHKNVEAHLDGKSFYDFGFGNQTAYYDVALGPDSTPEAGRGNGHHSKHFDLMGTAKHDTAAFLDEDGDTSYTVSSGGGRLDARATSKIFDEAEMEYVGVYSEDAFAARFERIIESKTPYDEKPLFLYTSHQSLHAPLGQPPDDELTSEEKDLLKTVNTRAPERTRLAATLLYLDKKIGMMVSALEERGWMENSLIVVASDNGACSSDGGSNYPLRGGKQSLFEGGTKVPAFVYSKSHIPEELWGTTYNGLMHITDWVPTLVSAIGGAITGSAGPLDGVDHWDWLTGVNRGATGPRTEMLYNWDQYLLSSSDGLRRNDSLAQGAYRMGKWKLITNAWCSYYATHDYAIQDPLLDTVQLCGGMTACSDCTDSCEGQELYKFGDWLFDLEADPRETTNLIFEYPEMAVKLRERALEVVNEGCSDSNVKEVDESSYTVWADNNWWMLPWLERLQRQS